MPKKGGGKQQGGKGKKVRIMLVKNGDPKCRHHANVVPSVRAILEEAGRNLKGIAQKGNDRCLFATDGYPISDVDLKNAKDHDIIVVSSGEAFIRTGGGTAQPGSKLYSQDGAYAGTAGGEGGGKEGGGFGMLILEALAVEFTPPPIGTSGRENVKTASHG